MRTELERYAERVLGPCRVEQDTSWEHGASCVLRVRDANGLGWYAKRHRRVEHHTREVAAYRRWVPVWGTRAPSLRAYDPALAALVVSEVPGVATAGDDVDVQQQAGTLLRRFHGAEALPRWSGFAADKLAELERWESRADGLLDRREWDFARAQVCALEGIPDPPRVPCHLDFSPRNWLVDSGRVYVVDFELAGPEVWVNDLSRLFFGVWRQRPELREAFLDGYGRTPDEEDLAILLGSYALTAVWMRIWARAHGETAFEAALRDNLHAMMRGEFARLG